jgi:hypothetical protein
LRPHFRAIACLVLIALVTLSSGAFKKASTYSEQTVQSHVISEAENFLVDQYNATIGLLPEYPGANTYWLYSDNFLANLALELTNPSNVTRAGIAENISLTVDRYSHKLPSAKNQYMALDSNLSAFNSSSNYRLSTVDSANVEITLNNGTSSLSPLFYSDIAFLRAIHYQRIGYHFLALLMFRLGVDNYDGIGFKDLAFKGIYQTYKLALYIYAAKILGQNYPPEVESTLLNMQAKNGGFYTGYDAEYTNAGTLTNVETTSLTILALSFPSSGSSQLDYFQIWQGFLVISLVLAAVISMVISVSNFEDSSEQK